MLDGGRRARPRRPAAPPPWPADARRRPASSSSDRLRVVDPLGYVEFMSLVRGATVVVTDSGGIQEETTILGVPCLTVRPNTERPITITHGTNRLVEPEAVPAAVDAILRGRHRPPSVMVRRCGMATPGERIAEIVQAWLDGRT